MLNEREKESLQCILDTWADNNSPIPGGCCYQDVIDLCQKLGVKMPQQFFDEIERIEAIAKKMGY